MAIAIPLIIAGIAGAAKTGFSLAQHASAEADLKNTIAPYYSIPQEWYDNDNIASAQAETGMSLPARNYYTKMSDAGLSSGLDAITKAGGNVNNVAELMDSYDNGLNKIAAGDDELRDQKIRTFLDQNANLGNEREKQWTLNQYEPYRNRVAADNQKAAISTQNAYSGLDDIGNAAAAFAVGNKYEKTPTTTSTQTFGQKFDSPTLTARGSMTDYSAPQLSGSIPSTAPSLDNPAMMGTLKQMTMDNPNSPYLQQFLNNLNNSNQVQ
jgi:hypothetical protein